MRSRAGSEMDRGGMVAGGVPLWDAHDTLTWNQQRGGDNDFRPFTLLHRVASLLEASTAAAIRVVAPASSPLRRLHRLGRKGVRSP